MTAKRIALLTVLTCLSGGATTPLVGQTAIAPMVSPDAGRTIPPHFLGVNTRAKVTGLWDNASDQTNLKRLGVTHLRFPGGIGANYYDWTTGDMLSPDAPHPHHSIDVENYRLSQLLTAHHTTGVAPVFVLNLLTSHRIPGYASALDSQLAMLRHAQHLGLPIERIELGNELYAPVYDAKTYPLSKVNMRGFFNANDYHATSSIWTSAIKAEFPEAHVGLVDTAVRSSDAAKLNRNYLWNRELNATDLSAFDALVRHHYSSAGLLDPQAASGSLAEIQQQQWSAFLAPDGPATVIGNAFSYMGDVAEHTQHPDGLPIWITEFNLMDKIGPVARTWSHALFSAAMLYGMLEDLPVELITSHSFHGHKFGAVFFENDEFPYMQIDPGYSLAATPGDFSATGHLMAMVNGAFDSMTHLAPLTFGQGPVVDGLGANVPAYPALVGHLLNNAQEQRMIVTNFSDQPMALDLAGVPGTWGQAVVLTADPREHILAEEDMHRSQVFLGDQLHLPAYSLAVVTAPEPTTLALLMLGISLFLRRRSV